MEFQLLYTMGSFMKSSELTELEQKYEDLKMQLSDVSIKMDALRDDAQQWNI